MINFRKPLINDRNEDIYLKAGGALDEKQRLKYYIVSTLEKANQYTLRLHILQSILHDEFRCKFDLFQLCHFSDVICFWRDSAEVYVSLIKNQNKKVVGRMVVEDIDPNYILPTVFISLRILTPRIHTLIADNGGSLPLEIFPKEYEKHFEDMNSLKNEHGVSFEHLISCVPGVRITKIDKRKMVASIADAGERKVQKITDEKLILLGSEITILLSQNRSCTIPLDSFLDYYLCRFNKPCAPKDYGVKNLDELLGKLNQVVQILGSGSKRQLTLSHEVQMYRFSSAVEDLLKNDGRNEYDISDLLDLFKSKYGKDFEARNYGLCTIEDLLMNVRDSKFKVERDSGKIKILYEGVDEASKKLQNSLIQYLMFNKGCVLYKDYFAKFPESKSLLKIVDRLDQIVVQTAKTDKDQLFILGKEYIRNWFCEKLFQHLQIYGYFLLDDFQLSLLGVDSRIKLEHLNVESNLKLFRLFPEVCKIEKLSHHKVKIRANTLNENRIYLTRLLTLVMDKAQGGGLDLDLLQKYYQNRYEHGYLSQSVIEHILKDRIVVYEHEILDQSFVYLTPIYSFAKEARALLRDTESWLTLDGFKKGYKEKFRQEVNTKIYGKDNIHELFNSISDVVVNTIHPETDEYLVKLVKEFRFEVRIPSKNRLAAVF